MALPTSGAISLNDIATEFGGTVPHSINEYYKGGGLVPNTSANANIPTSGQVSFSNYYGGQAGGGTWSAYSAANAIASSVAFDPSGNIYFGGVGNGAGSLNGYMNVNKANLTGTTSWKKQIVVSSELGSSRVYGISIDSSNNIYVAGNLINAGLSQGYLGKFTSSGTTVFQKRLTGGSGIQVSFYDVKVASLNEIYITAGFSNSDAYNLLKLDSSGNIVWQRRLSGGGDAGYPSRLNIDASGNVYVSGFLGNSTTLNGVLVKYNSSGTLQWQRRITNAAFNAVQFDSAGNVYVGGWSNYTSPRRPLIVKYNSAGDIQWQKTLTNGSSSVTESVGDLYIKSDSIFAVINAVDPNTAASVALLAKYDTSGTLIWQKYLSSTSCNSIKVDDSDNVIVGGQKIGFPTNSFVGIFPSLASATGGTALGVTLYTGLHTDGVPTITANTPTYTASTPALTLANSTATVSDATSITNSYATAA